MAHQTVGLNCNLITQGGKAIYCEVAAHILGTVVPEPKSGQLRYLGGVSAS